MNKIHALMKWLDELVLDENRDERELFSVWQNLQGELMRHFKFDYSERYEEIEQLVRYKEREQ